MTARAKETQPQQSIPHNITDLVDPLGLLSLSLTDNMWSSLVILSTQSAKELAIHKKGRQLQWIWSNRSITLWRAPKRLMNEWPLDSRRQLSGLRQMCDILVESQEWYMITRQVLNNKITNKNRFRNTSGVSCKNSKVTLLSG